MTTPLGHEPGPKAFIGVSLDSKAFTRPWVRLALAQLVANYSSVLVLLADELLLYTRTARSNQGDVVLDYHNAGDFMHRRSREMARFMESEVLRLPPVMRERVSIKTWSDFSDGDCHAGPR